LEEESIISKLKKSLEKDYGDAGRTQYIIEKLQKELPLPKSDHLYIERMIKLCELVFEEPEEISRFVSSLDLIKCYHCNLHIKLDEKSVRRNDYWFHEKCFEMSTIVKTQDSQKIEVSPKVKTQDSQKIEVSPKVKTQDSQKIEVSPKVTRHAVIVESKSAYPQMAFSGGLLASLVGTTYFLAGDLISSFVGIWGSALYFIIFKSQIIPKKKQEISVVKTGIPGFESQIIPKKKQEISVVKTGIPGLDSIISGGMKTGRAVTISGPPGSGKTTFGLQFIYSGAKEFDEPGVYISLSQNIDEIKNDCKTFGWDMDDLIAKEKILMIDLRPFKIKDKVIGKDDSLYRGEQIPFEHLTKFILNSIKKINAKRIVIDSISILGMQYSDKFYMRQGLQGMIQSLENFGVTSLILSEYSENDEIPLEWFVTSGIIHLDNQIINNKMMRTIKIIKLRGLEHSKQVHSLELGNNGLYIYEN